MMKIDIEFSKFLVFLNLLTSGVLCLDVNALMVEFHTSKCALMGYPISFPNCGEGGGPWMLETNKDTKRLKDEMIELMRRNLNYGMEIVVRDDKMHESDGLLWPAAAAAERGG